MTDTLHAPDTPRIAYVTTFFPGVTETAVIKEIFEVDQAGLMVDVYAMRGGFEGVFDAKAERFRTRSFYWPTTAKARGLAKHNLLLATSSRYRRIIKTVLAESGSAQMLLKNFAAVLFALAIIPQLKKRDTRYVHANFGAFQATTAWAIHELTGIPYGFTVHAHELFVAASLMRAKVENAAQVISISDYNVDFIRHRLNLPTGNVKIVRCGVDLAEYDPTTRTPAKAQRILAVGRLDEMKGFEYLIDAAAILKQRGHHIEAEIIGYDPGDRADALARRAQKQGVADRIHLRGIVSQDELWAAYRACDYFVLPCVTAADGAQDGIPATLMEAMAMEIPTISTQTSGIPELVLDGECGLIVPQKDAAGLADAIARFIEDPAYAEKLGKTGRVKVAADYDYAKNARKLARLIHKIIGE